MLASSRDAQVWQAAGGAWAYEQWGATGRPILLLHSPMLDRSIWRPVAAELADTFTVIALDLPGHGQSPPRSMYGCDRLADELAHFTHNLGTRAPIVVGHGAAAMLATRFGARFAVQAVVTVNQPLDLQSLARAVRVANAPMGASGPERAAVTGYRRWLTGRPVEQVQAEMLADLAAVGAPYLSVLARSPWPGYPDWLAASSPRARCVVYEVDGHLPHLADVGRFVADVRAIG
jgi:pimeloyl-ACP methyl ester carboxylesterase